MSSRQAGDNPPRRCAAPLQGGDRKNSPLGRGGPQGRGGFRWLRMRGIVLGCLVWSVVALPGLAETVTLAPALTDREIAERLTRLETRLDEGLTGLREGMAQLRDDMNSRFEEQSRQPCRSG